MRAALDRVINLVTLSLWLKSVRNIQSSMTADHHKKQSALSIQLCISIAIAKQLQKLCLREKIQSTETDYEWEIEQKRGERESKRGGEGEGERAFWRPSQRATDRQTEGV